MYASLTMFAAEPLCEFRRTLWIPKRIRNRKSEIRNARISDFEISQMPYKTNEKLTSLAIEHPRPYTSYYLVKPKVFYRFEDQDQGMLST